MTALIKYTYHVKAILGIILDLPVGDIMDPDPYLQVQQYYMSYHKFNWSRCIKNGKVLTNPQ